MFNRRKKQLSRPKGNMMFKSLLTRIRSHYKPAQGVIACVVLLISFALIAEAQEKARPELVAYQMALLSRGPKWTPETTPETERLQAEHMKNIQQMANDGKLVGAGPMLDNGDLRGIFIFKVGSLDEAKALAAADPAVKAGRLAAEVHPWLAPKGIGDRYFAAARANPQAKIEMATYQFGIALRGPNASEEVTPETQKIQADHVANVFRLLASGKLGAAGPFTDDADIRGIFVFQVGSLDEAKALVETDPAVKTGRLRVEFHPWMAAKGVLP